MGDFHLAQANITTGRWAFDHPRMRGFAARIDPINELAQQAPGFVWRPSSDQVMADLHRNLLLRARRQVPLAYFHLATALVGLEFWIGFVAAGTRVDQQSGLVLRPANRSPSHPRAFVPHALIAPM